MARYTVISADCHAGATYPNGGFLDYVEKEHRDRLRAEMSRLEREREERMAKLFAMEFMAEQDSTEAAREGGSVCHVRSSSGLVS